MKVNIVTSDPTIEGWSSLEKKKRNIADTLRQMKNVGQVVVEIQYWDGLRPPVINGRIPHSFMESLTKIYSKDEETFVVLHLSDNLRKEIGLQPSLRGIAFNDNNFYSEAYFWADERTKRKGYNQFEETSLHEIAHLMFHRNGRKDTTHEYHDANGSIKGLFKSFDYREYQAGIVARLASWIQNRYGASTTQALVRRQANLVVDKMAQLGYTVHVFKGFRSKERQNELYRQGRTESGNIVTNAKGGESFHNYGVAVDIVFGPEGEPSWDPKMPWKTLGKVGKEFGFEWGGDWKGFSDLPHFEMTLGYTVEDFKNKKVNYTKFQ